MVDLFAAEMKRKLRLKAADKRPWSWSRKDCQSGIVTSILDHAHRLDGLGAVDARQAVDLANLAMMVWFAHLDEQDRSAIGHAVTASLVQHLDDDIPMED